MNNINFPSSSNNDYYSYLESFGDDALFGNLVNDLEPSAKRDNHPEDAEPSAKRHCTSENIELPNQHPLSSAENPADLLVSSIMRAYINPVIPTLEPLGICTFCQILHISIDSGISLEDQKTLAGSLNRMESLEELKIEFHHPNSSENKANDLMNVLWNSLPKHQSLVKMKVEPADDVIRTQTDLDAFATFLRTNTTLTSLSMIKYNMSSPLNEGLFSLDNFVDAIQLNSTLSTLKLPHCFYRLPDGFFDVMMENRSIRTLDLTGCVRESVKSLSPFVRLIETNIRLETLKFSQTYCYSETKPDVLTRIEGALQFNPSLTYLNGAGYLASHAPNTGNASRTKDKIKEHIDRNRHNLEQKSLSLNNLLLSRFPLSTLIASL